MPNLSYEILHGLKDGKVICGVDEVGRGPLAGPVTACAAILPAKLPSAIKNQIRDSKQMTHKQREDLYPELISLCRYAVAEASVQEISELNILHASMLAMHRAVEGLQAVIDVALIDGNRIPKQLTCKATAIVGGDDKSLSIAVASIIAKVTRDKLMKKLAEEHPGYGWERNAGYGTKEHLDALKRLGATIWHRDSFAPVSQLRSLAG
ncbi:MAG TPA: ribonuclease HII [Alphaproteobacteria bacterium]|nr:ribonuclease HII [Alphaproteobacteria bacterium]